MPVSGEDCGGESAPAQQSPEPPDGLDSSPGEAESGLLLIAQERQRGHLDIRPERGNELALPRAVQTHWGSRTESIAALTRGRLVEFTQQAVSQLTFGQRVAFLEIFCGKMSITLGCRALGLCAPDGVDELFPFGGDPLGFAQEGSPEKVNVLLDALDP